VTVPVRTLSMPLAALLAAALTALAPAPALAQKEKAAAPKPAAAGAACARPEKPKLPDAKKAKTAEMEAAQKALGDYTGKMNAYIKCLDKAKFDAQNEHKAMSDQWNKAVDVYAKRPG